MICWGVGDEVIDLVWPIDEAHPLVNVAIGIVRAELLYATETATLPACLAPTLAPTPRSPTQRQPCQPQRGRPWVSSRSHPRRQFWRRRRREYGAVAITRVSRWVRCSPCCRARYCLERDGLERDHRHTVFAGTL